MKSIENFIFFTTLIIMLFMVAHLLENDLVSIKQRNRFIIICNIIVIGEILDYLAYFDLSSDSKNLIIRSIELVLSPIAIYIEVLAINKCNKFIKNIICFVDLTNIVLIIINYFYPILFVIEPNHSIFKLQYWNIYIAFYIMNFFALVYQLKELAIRNQNKNVISLLSIIMLLVLNLFIEIDKSSNVMNIEWFIVAISFIITYIYYIDLSFSIDHLTGLLNARSYRNRIKTVDFTTAIIFIDCNRFKTINDKFGHQAGDIALEEYAHSILEIFKKIGWVYRRSGDEFVVILKPGKLMELVQKNSQGNVNLELQLLLKKLEKNIEEKSKKIHYLELGLSYGYAVYVSRTENVSDYSDFWDDNEYQRFPSMDAVISKAEDEMYKYKNSSKEKLNNITEKLEREINVEDIFEITKSK